MTDNDVDTLKRFAARRGIKYPLLADAKSEAIRAFRLFNDGPPPESRYYGTSKPQVVVVNADGVVTRTFSGYSYTAN